VQETAAVAPALALAEPEDAPHKRLNEGSPADGLAVSHQLCTTTRDATVFPLRDPLTMPQLPFMHNVLAKRRAEGTSA
jgi:hypothetical protein